VHLAEAYTREGMRSDAAEVLRAAQATYPSDPDLGLATATVLYREGELAAAEAVLSSSSTASPGELHSDNFVGDPSVAAFRIRHLLAVIRYLQGRFQEAEEDARAVIDICPEFGEGWLLLADALLAQGKRQEHAIVGTTLSSIPGTEAARILISASARKRAGDLPGGLRLVEGGIGSHGEHPYLLRARDRLALGGPESWRGGAYFLSARDLPDLRR
jgi:tetratricopeptide (TPR) repeat protein